MEIGNDHKIIASSTEHDISYHKLNTSKKGRGKLNPRAIVIHYTAGSSFDNDVATLSTGSRKVSCHFVISETGEIAQIGDCQDICYHAGRSQWGNEEGLNDFAIGIEVTNPGFLTPTGSAGEFKTYWGEKIDESEGVIVAPKMYSSETREYGWKLFTKDQIDAILELCDALVVKYPQIKHIVGHEQISPGRKSDPGPCLPMNIRQQLNDMAGADGILWTSTTSNLNLRDKPDTRNSTVVSRLQPGDVCEYIDQNDEWFKVKFGRNMMQTAWVYSKFLKPIG